MSKNLIIATHFDDNPEKATLPWVVGAAALAEDHKVTIFLQGIAVKAAKAGAAEELHFPPFPPLGDLVSAFVEGGGNIYLCGPCMQAHSVANEELIEGAEAAGAAFLVALAEDASVFTY